MWQTGAGSNLEVGRALLASISGPSGFALLGATVLVEPMIEERLYRGYLVGALIERMPGAVVVVVSALLFVMLYFEPANLVASLCLGLGAGLCAVRTRSVLLGCSCILPAMPSACGRNALLGDSDWFKLQLQSERR